MRAGVLTFHRASNYGTALQAYATVKALQKLGVEAEIIDYRPEYIEATLRERNMRDAHNIKAVASIMLNRAIYGSQIKEKIVRFQQFINAMSVSETVCMTVAEVQKAAEAYDILVSGSDQLWNSQITGKDMMYFLPFSHPRKISYASSFGVETLSEERKAEILPYLRDFVAISAREKTACQLLSGMLQGNNAAGLTINRVVDPTLLLEKGEWLLERELQAKLPRNGYILTYYMIETPLLRVITDRLKRETGMPVVNIKPSKRQMLLHEGINMMWAGPREFLSCYAGAKYVVTNSFHGTAFAINFDIPMYVSPLPMSMAGDVNSRLIEILDWFGLSDRWIDSMEVVKKTTLRELPTDLKDIKRHHRMESIEILKRMLEEEK